jgi:DNA-binding NarL/FixJ family response regulator
MATSNINEKNIRVVVADNSKPMRDKVVQILQPEFEVVGTAADGNAALEMIQLLKPEIAILDISMPIMTAIEIAADLKKNESEVKVVILTVHDDPDYVRAALSAGALGYVVKSYMALDLITALTRVYSGGIFISPNCVMTSNQPDQ